MILGKKGIIDLCELQRDSEVGLEPLRHCCELGVVLNRFQSKS